MRYQRTKVVAISLGLLASLTPSMAEAAYTVAPKVGQCFMYSNAEVSSSYPLKNPVKCTLKHNAETYIVAKWPVSTHPDEMIYEDAWDIANSLCRAWGPGGRLQDSYFNYWAWYTPSKKDWIKGQRWLRCDAMHVENSEQPYIYTSWKGKKFQTKSNF